MDTAAGFGSARLEELEPPRHGREQVAHCDRRASRRARWSQRPRLALHHRHLCSERGRTRAAQQRHAGDGGNARQRLAAESQRGEALKIAQRLHLAGGVPRERQRQLLRGYATAVVADPNQAQATIGKLDTNMARAGIERVLDQLLDDRGRPLDDFARGDFGGDVRRKLAYWHVRKHLIPGRSPIWGEAASSMACNSIVTYRQYPCGGAGARGAARAALTGQTCRFMLVRRGTGDPGSADAAAPGLS